MGLVVLTAFIAALALGVAGSFLPAAPWLGIATGFVPPVMSWVVLAALAAGALALLRWVRRRDRFSAVLVVVTVLTLVGATVVTARMTAAVERAGVDIDLADTLRVWTGATAVPDTELAYGEFDGAPLTLSIYRPPTGTAVPAPVLVFVHGGGWVAGSRDAHAADLRWFADQGWLTISVDYPLATADRPTWDVAPDRIGCALAWVGANAAQHGGDPARISLAGDSAGGNLAINAAFTSTAGLESSCGGRIPKISAVSVLYPVVDPADFYANPDSALGGRSRDMASTYTGGSPTQFPERYAAIAAATHLNRVSHPAPPTSILVGAEDHLVPIGPTYRFADTARAAGVDVDLVVVPYADHVFDARTGSIGQQAFRQLTANWLRRHGQGP